MFDKPGSHGSINNQFIIRMIFDTTPTKASLSVTQDQLDLEATSDRPQEESHGKKCNENAQLKNELCHKTDL